MRNPFKRTPKNDQPEDPSSTETQQPDQDPAKQPSMAHAVEHDLVDEDEPEVEDTAVERPVLDQHDNSEATQLKQQQQWLDVSLHNRMLVGLWATAYFVSKEAPVQQRRTILSTIGKGMDQLMEFMAENVDKLDETAPPRLRHEQLKELVRRTVKASPHTISSVPELDPTRQGAKLPDLLEAQIVMSGIYGGSESEIALVHAIINRCAADVEIVHPVGMDSIPR